jgi:hypothetical protein
MAPHPISYGISESRRDCVSAHELDTFTWLERRDFLDLVRNFDHPDRRTGRAGSRDMVARSDQSCSMGRYVGNNHAPLSAARNIKQPVIQRSKQTMLWTIAVILVVLWLLGLVSSYTLGGFIHILLVLAVVIIIFNLIQGRRGT